MILFAGVFDAVGRIDFADNVPIKLVSDRDEFTFTRFLELFLQSRTFPIEGEESLTNFRRQCRIKIVGMPETSRWEGL